MAGALDAPRAPPSGFAGAPSKLLNGRHQAQLVLFREAPATVLLPR